MTNGRRAILAGLAAVLAYAGGALLSGHLSLTARGPLLDGVGTNPPPYRWVSPPPSLASSNQKPSSLRASIPLNPQTGSEANVWTTSDAQVSLGLDTGAIPPVPGQSSAKLTITPQAPGRTLTVPGGLTLVGNVYRIRIVYEPSGTEITTYAKSGVLVIAYPGPLHPVLYKHVLLRSGDATSWASSGGADSIGQQVVQEEVKAPGYFAVGQSRSGTPKKNSPARGILDVVLIAAAVAVVAFTVFIEVRHRRSRRRAEEATKR
jgi:hypothetical protein